MTKYTACLLLLIPIILPKMTLAGAGVFSKVYGSELNPFDTAGHITQDSQGYIWIAVAGKGLVRYNGKEFKIFNSKGDRGTQTTLTTTDSFINSKGEIVFTTRNGINILDTVNLEMDHVTSDRRDWDNPELLRQGYINTGFLDSKGVEWFLGTKFIFYFDEAKMSYIKAVSFEGDDSIDLYKGTITHDDTLWVSTLGSGLIEIKDGKVIRKLNPKTDKSLPQELNYVNAFHFLADNKTLLLGTDKGILAFDVIARTFTEVNRKVINKEIYHIEKGLGGVFWAAGKKVFHINSTFSKVDEIEIHEPSIPFSTLFVDREGTAWLSDWAGGVFKYSELGTGVEYINPFPDVGLSSANSRVYSIVEDGNQLLLGTSNGLLSYELSHRKTKRVSSFPDEKIYHLVKNGEDVWISTRRSLYLYRNNVATKIVDLFDKESTGNAGIRSFDIYEDIIYLFMDPGLAVYNIKENKLEINPDYLPDGAKRSGSTHIATSKREGLVYFSAYGFGLYMYNPKTKDYVFHERSSENIPAADIENVQFQGENAIIFYEDKFITSYNIKDKVFTQTNYPIANVKCIQEAKGYTWMFQSDGELYRYDKSNNKVDKYTRNDVPEIQTIRPGNCYKFSGDYLIGVTYGGFAFINLNHRIDTENPVKPLASLSNIKVSGKSYKMIDNTIELKPNENNISFDLISLSFVNPNENLFRYRFSKNEDWEMRTQQNSYLSFYGLPFGEHSLEIQVSNNSGLWSEPLLLLIKVDSPWYRTNFAYIAYLASFLFVVFLVFKIRQESKEKKILELTLSNKEISIAKNTAFEQQQIAEKANEAKTYLLHLISHEMNQPLASAYGLVQVLRNKATDDNTILYLDIIKGNLELNNRFLDDLLQLVDIEANRLEVINTTVDIVEVFNSVCEPFKLEAKQKNIEIVILGNTPTQFVEVDKHRIEQIISNLLSNAIKYTRKGTITASLNTFIEDKYCLTEIAVEDTGIGIQPEDQEKIFEMFERVDVSDTRENPGKGIGLYVVKKIVGALKGTIDIESELGSGSLFKVAFRSLCASEVNSNNKESAELRIENLLVMVVDDYSDTNTAFKAMLGILGAEVVLCSDGIEAIKTNLERRPDVIIMDCQLPGLSGPEIAKAIRKQEIANNMKPTIIIGCSGAGGNVKDRCLDSGMDGFMKKPLSMQEIVSTINKAKNARSLYPSQDFLKSN